MYFYTGVDRPLGLRGVEAPRIHRKSAHEGGKVISLMNRPPLPQETPLVLISVRGCFDPTATVRLEGQSQ